ISSTSSSTESLMVSSTSLLPGAVRKTADRPSSTKLSGTTSATSPTRVTIRPTRCDPSRSQHSSSVRTDTASSFSLILHSHPQPCAAEALTRHPRKHHRSPTHLHPTQSSGRSPTPHRYPETMSDLRNPGDAWVTAADGGRYWGRFGAAGLLAH